MTGWGNLPFENETLHKEQMEISWSSIYMEIYNVIEACTQIIVVNMWWCFHFTNYRRVRYDSEKKVNANLHNYSKSLRVVAALAWCKQAVSVSSAAPGDARIESTPQRRYMALSLLNHRFSLEQYTEDRHPLPLILTISMFWLNRS